MQKQLALKVKAVKIGNSTRITIPKPVAEFLGIKPGNTLLVSVDNERMVVKKQKDNGDKL